MAVAIQQRYEEVLRENRKLKFEIRLGQLIADGYKRRANAADAAHFANETCEECEHVGLGVHCFHLRRNGSVVSMICFHHCPACQAFGEF